MKALPFHSGAFSCYACDERAIGYRDLRPDTAKGRLEYACERHADPKIKVYEACIYCNDPVRKGSIDTGIGYAHRGCFNEDLESNPMTNRKLEEQQLLGDGWKTEWEPARLPDNVPTALANPSTEKEWESTDTVLK